jgi:5-formyltetrahydrofolate cyclo-ligase
MSALALEKKALRLRMQATLRTFDAEKLELRGGQVAHHLSEMIEWNRADTVLCYLSMPGELPTGSLIDAARRDGKALAVPRIEGVIITFLILPPDAGALPLDRWNIPIPDPRWTPFEATKAGRVLVAAPGLAFDREGHRLGRGKGFYDRFLPRLRSEAQGSIVLGLCLSEQLVPAVPCEAYDQRMDGLVTELGSTIFTVG